MPIILPGSDSLVQHNHEMILNPDQYKPSHCPHCKNKKLHNHGTYPRHPDRSDHSEDSLNPVLIPRFRCAYEQCRKTCSVLPQCIAPRRWFLWSVQQNMLFLLLTNQLSDDRNKPHIRTIWRWWARLKKCFHSHRYHLCGFDVTLGQYGKAATFWAACLAKYPLSKMMLFLHQQKVCVP